MDIHCTLSVLKDTSLNVLQFKIFQILCCSLTEQSGSWKYHIFDSIWSLVSSHLIPGKRTSNTLSLDISFFFYPVYFRFIFLIFFFSGVQSPSCRVHFHLRKSLKYIGCYHNRCNRNALRLHGVKIQKKNFKKITNNKFLNKRFCLSSWKCSRIN